MGSLVGGWDATRPGKAPKGFEDYKEPYTPRSSRKVSPFEEPSPQGSGDMDKSAGGPPNLARTSAPPIHGASTVQRYLTRASGSGASAPTSPRAPLSPRTRTAPKHLTLKVGDSDEPLMSLQDKEKWCSRVESATLNLRPDVDDQESWRHGGFKVDDPCHAMHLPVSPRSAAAATADGMAPFTPPAAGAAAGVQPQPQPRVTVTRLPQEAAESFECAGL